MEQAVNFLVADTACGTPIRWWLLDAEATMAAWSVAGRIDEFWDRFWTEFSRRISGGEERIYNKDYDGIDGNSTERVTGSERKPRRR